jgi:hypothetical protein
VPVFFGILCRCPHPCKAHCDERGCCSAGVSNGLLAAFSNLSGERRGSGSVRRETRPFRLPRGTLHTRMRFFGGPFGLRDCELCFQTAAGVGSHRREREDDLYAVPGARRLLLGSKGRCARKQHWPCAPVHLFSLFPCTLQRESLRRAVFVLVVVRSLLTFTGNAALRLRREKQRS